MAVKRIYSDNSNESSEKLPLLRQWAKEQEKIGNSVWEIPIKIQGLTLSKSKEWIIIQEDRFIALVHADSQLGEDLLNIIENLRGDCYALVIIPHKKGKLGFSIGIDDEISCYAGCNTIQYESQPYIWFSNKPPYRQDSSKSNRISLENLKKPIDSPTASVIDNCNLITTEAQLDMTEPQASKKSSQRRQKSDLNGMGINK